MKFLVVGDVHSHYTALRDLILKHPEVSFVLQTGDLGFFRNMKRAKKDRESLEKTPKLIKSFTRRFKEFERGIYDIKLPKPVYFVKGAHEDFLMLRHEKELLRAMNITLLEQGSINNLDGMIVQGFGGIYSPTNINMQEPQTRAYDDRFFTNEDITRAVILAKAQKKIDLLLLHPGPKHIRKQVMFERTYKKEVGCSSIYSLIHRTAPETVFHGCHHINYDDGVIHGLGNFCKNRNSYKLVEYEKGNLSILN